MKKAIGFLICLCLGWQTVVAEVIHGTCGVEGDNVTWILDTESETLTFRGTGAMADSTISLWRDYTIKNIVVDEGVTNISWRMIGRGSCRNAETLFISSTVEEIPMDFDYLYTLASINVSEDNPNYSSDGGVLYNKYKTELIAYPGRLQMSSFVVPDSVCNIGKHAFFYCEFLDSVIISKNVHSISPLAFRREYNMKFLNIVVDADNLNYSSEDGVLYNKNKTALIKHCGGGIDKTFVIPDGVETVEGFAFDYIDSLVIAETVVNIANNGLQGFRAVVSLPLVPPTNFTFMNFAGCMVHVPAESIWLYRFGTTAYTWSMGSWEDMYTSEDRERIMREIVPIADSTILEYNGIYYKKILEKDNVLKVICNPYELYSGDIVIADIGGIPTGTKDPNGEWFFYNLSINYRDYWVKEVSDYAFYKCSDITSVTIPYYLEEIGDFAFYECI